MARVPKICPTSGVEVAIEVATEVKRVARVVRVARIVPVYASLISAQYRPYYDAAEETAAVEVIVAPIITSIVAVPSTVISLRAVAIVAAAASIAMSRKAWLVEFAAASIASVVGKG